MHRTVTIKEILEFLEHQNVKFYYHGDDGGEVEGFSSLFNYKQKTMTFISTLYQFSDYEPRFKKQKIMLIIASLSQEPSDKFSHLIQVERPTDIFFLIIDRFFSSNRNEEVLFSVEETNKKNTYVSKGAVIGENVKIGFGCVIEPNVVIGDNTIIHHNVIIRSRTKIGANCTINSGTIIGEQGFNPTTQEDGSKRLLKHYGGVTIEDDVYIGANCNIHKGTIDDTVLKKGVKLNAKVHVAHNCIIGEETVVTLPTFICGSVMIGRRCHIAASTIRNQITIEDDAILGLGSVVIKDVKKGKLL